MKGKKLLAGIISAAMVMGTMVVPAFADTNTISFDDFVAAVRAGKGTL